MNLGEWVAAGVSVSGALVAVVTALRSVRASERMAKAELEKTAVDGFNSLCVQLQQRITSNENDVTQMRKELADMRNENAELRRQIRALEEENAGLRRQLRDLQDRQPGEPPCPAS
jgi:septal ring factor EnvC (AmiA/AmiB activator)